MLKILAISGLCVLLAINTQASESNFSSKDSNWQQDMINSFNTQAGITDFSYAPDGHFRSSCASCEYDGNIMRCDCDNKLYNLAALPTKIVVGNCQDIAYNAFRGKLMCANS